MRKLNSLLLNMSRSSAVLTRDIHWKDACSHVRRIIPPLTFDSHKGQMGRIGVIGGSKEYTGAPFYASKAALLFGADLVFIFCAEEALLPIKSYSPEFMVTSLYSGEDEVGSLAQLIVAKVRVSLWRLHVVLMGPGMGR